MVNAHEESRAASLLAPVLVTEVPLVIPALAALFEALC